MTLKHRIQAFCLFAVILTFPGAIYAELGQDTHIQETGVVRIDIDRAAYLEFQRMFRLGYPPATVMMHAVTTGMSLNDILYIAVKSNVSRAKEFYETAKSLVPVLPGWVCQAKPEAQRYISAATDSEVGKKPTLQHVANLFFDRDLRLVPFPDWEKGQVQMHASVNDVANLINGRKWYVPGKNDGTPLTDPNRPVFVSLYKNKNQIIVDASKSRIREARKKGIKSFPVVLVYNNKLQRPVSSFPANVTVAELAQDFYSKGLELTAVPEWEVGDYQILATPAEIEKVVNIPDRKKIPKEQWDAAVKKFENNNMKLTRPLLLTLVRAGGGHAWVNDPATVAVAANMGVKELPVVFFYQRMDRTPCGEPSNCGQMLCEAATAAGAPKTVCSSNQKQGTTAGAGHDRGGAARVDSPFGMAVDPHLYDGLRYTQSQCTS